MAFYITMSDLPFFVLQNWKHFKVEGEGYGGELQVILEPLVVVVHGVVEYLQHIVSICQHDIHALMVFLASPCQLTRLV